MKEFPMPNITGQRLEAPEAGNLASADCSGRRMLPLGNARLRRALWMPTLSAIRVNPSF
jgi:hypothetical protein